MRLLAYCFVVLILTTGGCQPAAAEPPTGADRQGGEDTAGQASSSTQHAEQPAAEGKKPEHPFPRRMEAPPLDGGLGWLNTAGPIEIEDLKGKFVLLDFWTYCCINCMHILPELKKLEEAYPNELVVIGVHSAKFEAEADSQNIADAVQRYEIAHPVVNDANHAIWDNYFVNSWPSLRIIDPEGNLVAGHGGEIDFETLDRFLKEALPYYRAKGAVDPTPLHFDLESAKAQRTPLRYPGKLLADEAGGRLFISDSNHNRIVVTDLNGKLIETIGAGTIGAKDGAYVAANFNRPQGMALADQTLYVADTENHTLRKIDLANKTVSTIAGTGKQGRNPWPGVDPFQAPGEGPPKLPERFVGPPKETALNSPWDLWIHGGDLFIAMAGPHQIWKMPLDEKEIGPYAGNGREDIVDGPLLPSEPYGLGSSSFAQPSGLASDGTQLFVADSEGSSIRGVPLDGAGNVSTIIGTAHLPAGRLFAFGDVDGPSPDARLQHALGVLFHRGQLYVADTYNNKIKVIDLAAGSVKSLVGTGKPGHDDAEPSFDEPSGLAAAGNKLYVADTNNHLVRVIDLDQWHKVTTLAIEGLEPPAPPRVEGRRFADAQRAPAVVARVKPVEGRATFQVRLKLPEGYEINAEAPMGYEVTAVGEAGAVGREALGKLVRLEKPAAEFTVELPATAGQDKLELGLVYYYCREGAGGVCKVGEVVWPIELTVADDGAAAVELSYDVPEVATGPALPVLEPAGDAAGSE